MFCPECGKFNPDENQVCQYCNSLLIDNSAPVSTEQSAEAPAPQTAGEGSNDVVLNIPKLDLAKAKSFFMKNKFIIIPILAVVIAFIIFVSVGSSMSSPEKVVRNYYNALVNGEYEDMYDYIALPEGDFTTKENFVKHMKAINKDDNSLPKQTDFRVEEIRDNINNFENGMSASTEKEKNDSPLKKYTVTFYDKSTGATDSYTVTLIEQDTKKLLFFKDYKVSSAGLIVKNVQFEIAGDAQIKIDGKTLKNPKKNEDGNKVYKIDTIFAGNHDMTLTSELYETYKSEFNVNSDNYHQKIYVADAMKVKEKIVTSLEKTALSDFKTIYENAMAQKSFPKSIKLSEDEDKLVTERYNELLEDLAPNEDGTGLNSITFKSGKIRTSRYSDDLQYSVGQDDSGNTYISFTLDIEYEYKATVDTGWFTSNIQTREDTRTDDISFKYVYIDGKWALSYISTCSLYY